MTDTSTESTESEAAAQEAEPETFSREYVESLRKENAKYRSKAVESQEAFKTAEKARMASLTEAERAVAEAEQRGRDTATSEFGMRLARSAFDAAAGRKNPGVNTDEALEFVDISKFLGSDGEPDAKVIQAAVDRYVKEPEQGAVSYDGGTRTTTKPGGDMNQIIRKAAGLG